MCGIAGVLAGPGGRVDTAALRAVTAALRSRGPDGEGFHEEDGLAFGHRRLAIIDIAGGAQPLYAAGRTVVGVVNGEIYNFVDLKRQLQAHGHEFVSNSDSEVVVHGYAQWGEDVLDQLEGQFALAIWDQRKNQMLLARDRMGEKPLFYAVLADGAIVFGSELRALLRYPGVDRTVAAESLAQYLVYEYVPAPSTIIRGAQKLAPGHKLIATRGDPLRVVPYWDLPLADDSTGGREKLLVPTAALLQSKIRDSVRARLVADVPVGIFLSGGLDSSLIAAVAADLRNGNVDTFSIGFADPSYDESASARVVAQAIGSRHHEQILEASDLLGLIPRLGELLDEPLGDGSLIPTYLLCRFAREHVTVALGGDGGDELFAGYPTFLAEALTAPILDRMPRRLVTGLRRAGGSIARRLPVSTDNFSFDFKVRQFLRGMEFSGAHRHQAWLGSLVPAEVSGLLGADMRQQRGDTDPFSVIDERLARCSAEDSWDKLLYFYVKGYLGDDVLSKVDRASMQVSLEVRCPLLDREIIRLACAAAPSLRVRGIQTKRLLKQAARGVVPDSIIDRKKHGFGMPIAGWLRGPLKEFVADTLSCERLRRDGYFDPAEVEKLVSEHMGGRANHRKVLWSLIAFQCWQDNCGDHRGAE